MTAGIPRRRENVEYEESRSDATKHRAMNDLPNETWTSAYLDGELTAEQRAAFEAWLADHPDAQQLLDELRSAGDALRSLPRESLGPEFAAAVLRQAERAVLLPPTGGDNRPAVLPARSIGQPPDVRFDWGRWSRPLLWSAIATAAALLIVVFSPKQHEEGMIATSTEPGFMGRELTEGTPRAGEAGADTPAVTGEYLAEARREAVRLSKEPAAAAVVDSSHLDAATGSSRLAKGGGIPEAPEIAARSPLDRNLIVVCEMTPQAVQHQYFTQVLAKNAVAVENISSHLQGDRAADALAAKESRPVAKEVPGSQPRKAGREDETDRTAADGYFAAEEVPQQTVYLVEASPQQLVNVLAELQNDRREVLAINVDPAPQIPAQQHLFAYSRDTDTNELQLFSSSQPPASAQSAEQAPAAGAAPMPGVSAAAPSAPAETKQEPASQALVNQSQTSVSALQPGAPRQTAISDAPSEQRAVDFGHLQNQIRRQIPLEAQQAILSELEIFSNALPEEGQKEFARTTSQDALLSNGRAKQIESNRLRRIDAVLPQSAYSNVTPDHRHQDAPQDSKSSTAAPSPYFGKGGNLARSQTAIQRDNLPRFGASANVGPRRSTPAQQSAGAVVGGEGAAADKADAKNAPASSVAADQTKGAGRDSAEGQESLMRAVFVIQARTRNLEEPAAPVPATQTPTPSNSPPE